MPGGWTAVALSLDRLSGGMAPTFSTCLFDVDVTAASIAFKVRTYLNGAPRRGVRIFASRRGDRHAVMEARAIGATAVIDRPVSDVALGQLLVTLGAARNADMPSSTVLGAVAIARAFGALTDDSELSARDFADIAGDVGQDIAEHGVQAWLQTIRHHHLGTYQHCLLVTGLASAFGAELGLSAADASDLTTAALLHDIGKARISRDVLDKPGRLDAREMALIRMHPVWGDEHLETRSDVSDAIRDGVRHHHEYLDGSGYPDGLSGAEVRDLTRLLTIVDIFAALIERRSYKPPDTPANAMRILRGMAIAGRLERALVEAFAPVAEHLQSPDAAQDDDVVARSRSGRG